jgi:acyl carrier protein
MEDKVILEKLEEIVKKKVNNADITLDSKLVDLGLDSLDKAEILISIEETFGFEFNEEEMENISSVNDLVVLIKAKVSK